jgi:hypothetical protein
MTCPMVIEGVPRVVGRGQSVIACVINIDLYSNGKSKYISSMIIVLWQDELITMSNEMKGFLILENQGNSGKIAISTSIF